MTYKPQQNNRSKNTAFVLLIGAVVVWAISSFVSVGGAFIQLAAIVIAVVGIQIFVRYSLSEFRYILEDDDDGDTSLLIYKRQGAREMKVCHVSLGKTVAVFKLNSMPDFQKKYGTTSNRFNYCQNMGKDNMYVLIFRDGEKLIEVRFEPDEAFAAEMQKRMAVGEDDGRGFVM
ncbi:MAG: hypothetical protein HFE63_07565 [Clostridiales bacterium]|nr:hypothetical protein [Clostridiales bacterium]